MKTEFRNRAFLPVALPLMILGAMAVIIGLFAWILLYNTKDGALALAAVMATGILVAVALAANSDPEEAGARGKLGVVLALGVPVIFGAGLAATGGGVDDASKLNINREEIVLIPEVNVTLVAVNSQEFEQTELALPANVEAAIVFDNEEDGIPHNVALKLAGAGGTEPDSLNDPIAASPILPGINESFVAFTLEPGEYWYWCQVHPNMNGVLTVAEGIDPSGADNA